MKAREIMTKISTGKYDPIPQNQTEFQKDCILLFQESGATKKQAERATCQIWTENYYTSNEINLYHILQQVEKLAFIFKE